VKIRTPDHGRLLGLGFANPNQAPWSGTGVLLQRGDCLSTTHGGSKERSVNRNGQHLMKDYRSCK
jgi:hypothetical protein